MDNTMKGECTITLGEEEVKLKFCMSAVRETLQILNMELGEFYEHIKSNPLDSAGALVAGAIRRTHILNGDFEKAKSVRLDVTIARLDDLPKEQGDLLAKAIAEANLLGKKKAPEEAQGQSES
ncbi:hypothetical protein [Sanyastnella coralliicola]|uniref:hypothetical protein n=1 Tax=Sanyastnella coralliicola TaxID=3069118 RepID=UPI0027BABA29|nr:hypothetical protein [Longitalea sp. SCSIO 12813]